MSVAKPTLHLAVLLGAILPGGGCARVGSQPSGTADRGDTGVVTDAPAPPVPVGDALTVVDDATTVVGDATTVVGDATTVVGDATITGEGPAATGCADTFFDSFDNGVLGAKWDSIDQAGASFSLDTSSVSSPPNALLVTLSAAGGHARLAKNLPRGKDVCCELSLQGYADFISLFALQGRGGNYDVTFGYGSGSFSATEDFYVGPSHPDNFNRSIGLLPQSSAKRRMRVEARFPPTIGKGSLRVFIDGAPVLLATVGSDNQDIAVDTLAIGMLYTETTTSAQIRYDDVGCAVR
jgi:hypothetical protein